MKLVFFIIFSSSFIFCSNVKKQERVKDYNLEGVWILEEYINPILDNKTVVKSRMLKPSFFGILISIDSVKINFYGSLNSTLINNYNLSNKKKSVNFENKDNSKWTLEYDESKEKIVIYEVNDTIKYHYKKLDDIDDLNANNVSKKITKYFNDYLIKGTYEIVLPKLSKGNIVEFGENGSLKGLGIYEEFKIYNFFGTLHQYGNQEDVLFVINEKEESYKAFNWRFENDKLILLEFIEDPQYPKEKYITGNNKIILKKK